MGTPPAPPFAMLYFSLHEDKCVSIFNENIIFYKRFIDDIFGIWAPMINNKNRYQNFQDKMNRWHNLTWEFENLKKTVNFMDLTITSKDNKIHMTLFEKHQNLHLYIPQDLLTHLGSSMVLLKAWYIKQKNSAPTQKIRKKNYKSLLTTFKIEDGNPIKSNDASSLH